MAEQQDDAPKTNQIWKILINQSPFSSDFQVPATRPQPSLGLLGGLLADPPRTDDRELRRRLIFDGIRSRLHAAKYQTGLQFLGGHEIAVAEKDYRLLTYSDKYDLPLSGDWRLTVLLHAADSHPELMEKNSKGRPKTRPNFTRRGLLASFLEESLLDDYLQTKAFLTERDGTEPSEAALLAYMVTNGIGTNKPPAPAFHEDGRENVQHQRSVKTLARYLSTEKSRAGLSGKRGRPRKQPADEK